MPVLARLKKMIQQFFKKTKKGGLPEYTIL